MEELVKFLEKVGVDNQVIAQLKDPEEGLNVDELTDEFKQKQREVYANDPDVIKELAAQAKGKERGSVERKIKKIFNISTEEWQEHELDKDYEKSLLFGYEKIKKEGNKSAQEIQADLQEANKKLKWFEEEKIPEIEKNWQTRIDRNDIERHFRKLIVDSGELIVSHDVASTVIDKRLNEKGFIAELTDDRGGIVIKTRDGLIPQDEGKTRNLTNMEIVKGILGSEKLVKESHATEPKPPTPKFTSEPVPGQKADELPGMAAARANLEEVKRVERTERITGKPVK